VALDEVLQRVPLDRHADVVTEERQDVGAARVGVFDEELRERPGVVGRECRRAVAARGVPQRVQHVRGRLRLREADGAIGHADQCAKDVAAEVHARVRQQVAHDPPQRRERADERQRVERGEQHPPLPVVEALQVDAVSAGPSLQNSAPRRRALRRLLRVRHTHLHDNDADRPRAPLGSISITVRSTLARKSRTHPTTPFWTFGAIVQV
jgi:hypothetical protein